MAQKYDIAARLHADASGFVAAFAAAEASVARFNRSVNGTNVSQATANLGTFEKANQRAGYAVDTGARQLDRFNRTARGFAMTGIAGAVGLGAAMIGSLKTFASYESGLAGVKKTVDGTAKDYRTLDLAFRKMTTTMPATYEEITKVAEAAGQLGIKKSGIAKFTETMIRLGTSTNLSAEEAATAIAQISNVMGTAEGDVDRFGATLVALGNNFATTEADIVAMAQRLAGMGRQMGMSEADVLSLATAMSSVGIKAEMGGSAMSSVMVKMNKALQAGGKEAQAWADVMGVSADKAKEKIGKDAYGALELLLKGLEKSHKSGKNLDEVLGELGLKELRQVDTMKRLTGAIDQVSNARKLGNQAWKDNTALIDESNKRYETFASKVQMAWNRIRNIFANMGAAIAGSKSGMVDALDSILQAVERTTNKFIDSEGNITQFGHSFATAAKFITGAAAVVGLAGAAFMAFGPTGAIVVGVVGGLALITGAFVKLVDHFNASPLEQAMRKFEGIADDSTRNTAKSYAQLRSNVDNSLGDLVTSMSARGNEVKDAFGKGIEGLSGKTDAELAAMKDKTLSQVKDLTNKTIQELNGTKDKLIALNKSLMEGASDGEIQALEHANQVIEQETQRKIDIVKNAQNTISQILNSAVSERRKITQSEWRDLGTAFGEIDKQFKTSVGNSIGDLAKLEAAFGKLDKTASLDTIQNSLTKVGQKTAEALGELDTWYNKQSEYIKKNVDDQATQELMLGNLNRAYKDHNYALQDNYDKEVQAAKALNSKVDGMKGLTEEQKRQLGVVDQLTNSEARFGSTQDIMNHKTKDFASALKDSAKAQEEASKRSEELSKKYNELGHNIGSIPEQFKAMKDSSLEAATAIGKGFVTKFKDGTEGVDITGVGKMKVDEFVKGVRGGQFSVEDVAIAQVNAMRNKMGQESLTVEGRQTLESYVNGFKSGVSSVDEIATQIGVNLKSKSKVDLGPEGKVSTETFVNGLKDGTYGMAEFQAFLNGRMKEIGKADLTNVGKEDMATLQAGLESGLISVDNVTSLLETNLKEKSKVDLNEEGKKSLETLVNGMRDGSVSAKEFMSELKKIVKENSKADLTEEGKKTGKSYSDGVKSKKDEAKASGEELTKGVDEALQASGAGAATGGLSTALKFAQGLFTGKGDVDTMSKLLGDSPENILANATDGGGGANVVSKFLSGLNDGQVQALASAGLLKGIPESILPGATDGGGGANAGNLFNNGLFSAITGANTNSYSLMGIPQSILPNATDGGGGAKAGGEFAGGIFNSIGTAFRDAFSLMSVPGGVLPQATDGGGGSKAGQEFYSGLSGFLSIVFGTSSAIKGGTESRLGSTTDGGGGSKAGSAFNGGLSNFIGNIFGTSNSIKGGTESRLGSTTDGGGGKKSGSTFNNGLNGFTGNIFGTSNKIKSGTQSRLGSTTDNGGGAKAGGMFVTGLGNKAGPARSAGVSVSSSGKNGLSQTGGSFGLGQDLGQGFVNGISSMIRHARNAASALANAALGAIRSAQRSNSPAKETISLGNDFSDGYQIGIEENARYAVSSAKDMASDSIGAFDKVLGNNPFDFGNMNFDAVRRNLNGMRPQMNHVVQSNMKVDMPATRMRVDVNVHADQDWIRTEVNNGNAIDERLNYMGR